MSRRLAYENNRLYEYDFRAVGFISRSWEEYRITNPSRMIFPQKGSRAYYQVGDCIFTREWPRSDAASRYEEFASSLNSEHSWGSLVMLLLGMSTIKITKEIVEINSVGSTFRVVFRSHLVISDKERLQLHYRGGSETETISESSLNETYTWTGLIHSTEAIRPAANAMVEIISLPIGGAARQGATRVLAPLMRRYGRRIFLRLFTATGKGTVHSFVRNQMVQKTGIFFAKLARDTVKNAITSYYTELITNQDRQAVDPSAVRQMRMEVIIAHAFRDAVAENVTGAIKSGIGKLVPESAADGLFDPAVTERITNYMTRKMLQEAFNPLNEILKSSILSVNFGGDEKSYQQRLTDDLEKKFVKRYTGGIFADLVGSALEDILTDPALVI